MRFYIYEVYLDNSVYTELNNSKYYVGKHKTECMDLMNDGYYGSGALLNNLYRLYGYSGVKKRILKECSSEKENCLFEKYFIQQCKSQYGDDCLNVQVSSKKLELNYDENNVAHIEIKKQNNNFDWYTDGKTNIKVWKNGLPPKGFEKGLVFKESTIKRKAKEKRTKEIDKQNLKKVPLKERKLIKKQLEYDKITAKEKRELLEQISIRGLDKHINDLLRRGLNNEEIFNIVKLKEGKYYLEFNNLLSDYILEQTLIYQLSKMPAYFNTINDSLKALYEKNKPLQHRKDLESYLTSMI